MQSANYETVFILQYGIQSVIILNSHGRMKMFEIALCYIRHAICNMEHDDRVTELSTGELQCK